VITDLDLLTDERARLDARIDAAHVEQRDGGVPAIVVDMEIPDAGSGTLDQRVSGFPLAHEHCRARAGGKYHQVIAIRHIQITFMTHVHSDGRTLARVRNQIPDLLVIHSCPHVCGPVVRVRVPGLSGSAFVRLVASESEYV